MTSSLEKEEAEISRLQIALKVQNISECSSDSDDSNDDENSVEV